MRSTFLYFLLAAGALHAQSESVARFSNGDQLTGSLDSLSLENIIWKSEILKSPAQFDLKHVVDLSMPSVLKSFEGPNAPEHEAVLKLTNGDSVKGQLTGLTDDEISINTWYAGELVFRRVIVDSVKISRSSDIYYRGPNGIDEWTMPGGSDNWSFKSDSLVSNGTGGISKEMDFPDEMKISFDASWEGSFRPKIILFSDDIESVDPDKGYEMVFQGNSVHVKKAGSNTWLGHSTNARSLREREKSNIELRASKKSGKILLYIDDKFVDIWEDVNVKADELGNGFHLITQNNSPLSISNIVVSEWDGYTENIPQRRNQFGGRMFRGGIQLNNRNNEQEKEEEKTEEGRMVLLNGDSIKGEVLGIEDEVIALKTPLAEVKFPVSRLKNIVLKSADMETPKRYKGDVRATLSDGSRLVFRLDQVNGETLVGFSQNFGQAEFSRSSFKKIEFNIYNRDLDHLRAE
ncbi:MAG: hypothetical protein AB8D78_11820 [Akkermansiaceae bacterium]